MDKKKSDWFRSVQLWNPDSPSHAEEDVDICLVITFIPYCRVCPGDQTLQQNESTEEIEHTFIQNCERVKSVELYRT
ncbi:transcription factor HHO3 [Trifolium repens]|nr:transcription factor HHO3 [Trifolium repens]